MKNTLQIKQTLKHNISYSKKFSKQLHIMSLNTQSVKEMLKNLAMTNPFINYEAPIDDYEYFLASKISLKEHLYYELHTSSFNYKDKICNYIIESLDKHGFYTENIEEACAYLKVSKEAFLFNLKIIQSLEPIGVGARSMKECLLLQLQAKQYIQAYQLLDKYDKQIAQQDFTYIQNEMNIDSDELNTLLSDIRTCNPFPCSEYDNEPSKYITPIFTIIKEGESLRIELEQYGNISINKTDEKLDSNMKKYLKEAHFYIDELNRRNTTILAIANELLNIQKDYFLHGMPLKACTLKDISLKTGYNISTISRITSTNIYTFNNTNYNIKELFVSKTKKGSSKQEIIYHMKKILESNSNISDNKLALELQKHNLYVSRRTVNKYRNQLTLNNKK